MHIAPLRPGRCDAGNGRCRARIAAREFISVSAADDLSYFEIASILQRWSVFASDRVRPERAVDRGLPETEVARYTTLESSRLMALRGLTALDPYRVIESVFELQLTHENF